MRVLPRHDIFIVYSQAEAAPLQLVRTLCDELSEVGITPPGYEEMDWFVPPPAGDSGVGCDAPSLEQMVNTPMLERYFSSARCVVVMAQQLTEGVRVELDLLAKAAAAPAVIAVAWAEAALDLPLKPFAQLRIARWRPADALRHARQLRAWIWLAVQLDRLREHGATGAWVIGDLVARNKEAAALVAGGTRYPQALRAKARQALDSPRPQAPRPAPPADLAHDDALALWRYWNSGQSMLTAHLAKTLPAASRRPLDALKRHLDAVCITLTARFPGTMVLDAEGRTDEAEARFRIGAAEPAARAVASPPRDEVEANEQFSRHMFQAMDLAQSPRTAELALAAFDAALSIARGLAPQYRHNVLIRRAELLMHMERLQQVVADLDAILSDEAPVDEYARFSVRYLRGGGHFGLGQWASAIEDYSAVVDDRRAPDATRLSARLRRGVAHQKAGNLQAAKADYEAVLADPRASDSTRRTAQHNLADAMRAG